MNIKTTILALAAALAAAAFAPSAAHASNDWYWSPERAELALETYDEDTAADTTGAACAGTGHTMRGNRGGVHRLYRKFNCDLYDPSGDYLGSGTIRITGQSLRRYKWINWDAA